MSTQRYDWWPYVKGMIRRYPQLCSEYAELHEQNVTANMSGMPGSHNSSRTVEDIAIRELPATKQREYEAVRRAVETLRHSKGGTDKLRMIELMYWKRSHTLDGAAMAVGYSYGEARKVNRHFIYAVAGNYGLLDKV